MYLTAVTGEQLIREISKRQPIYELSNDFPNDFNRRRAARLRTFHEPVGCRVNITEDQKIKSFFLNFSDSGALLKGPIKTQLGQKIDLYVPFADSGETFVLHAQVMRFQNADVGVKFI